MNWEPYYGNESDYPNELPPPRITRGGGVSFREHLGKPLTEKLWEDITMRLCARSLRIYRPGEPKVTMFVALDGNVDIYLDQDGLVQDIDFSPYHAYHWQPESGEEVPPLKPGKNEWRIDYRSPNTAIYDPPGSNP